MSKAYKNHHVFRFADFVLDVDRSALLRDGEEIKLRPKSFDVLNYLVQHNGRLVSRDELLEAVWRGSVVTEDAVTQCLIDIRRALGDTSQELIRTVTRRGYIFELPVTEVRDADVRIAASSPRLRIVIAVSAGLLLVVGIAFMTLWRAAPEERASDAGRTITTTAPSDHAIAVLPFSIMSDDREQSYFADGVAEEILNLLARQSGLMVIARTSSFSYRGRDVNVSTIARQLGV